MISFENDDYLIIEDKDSIVNIELFGSKFTDYFYKFDYVVGDVSYGNLRLKGFYDSNNSLVSKHNDINEIKNYIANKCAYGCSYFILKKVN